MKLSARQVMLALALAGAVSTPARADAPTKDSRISAAPSRELADLLAKGKAALGAEQAAMLVAAVADAQQRLVASARVANTVKGEPLAVDATIAAALADAGLASGKAKAKLLPVYTALATMQLALDLHDALRERTGLQRAVRSVIACKGEAPCLDTITPTADMTSEHIVAARKMKDLDAEDRLGNFEIQTLSSVSSRVKSSDKQQKAVLDFIKG